MSGTNTCPTACMARQLGKSAVVGVKSHCLPPSLSSVSTVSTRGMEIIILTAAEITHMTGLSPTAESVAPGLKCADGTTILRSRDVVTMDGSRGTVYVGAVQTVPAGQDSDFQTLIRWADKYKRMDINGVGK